MGCRELQYYFRDGVNSDYHRASGSIPNRFAFRFSSEYHDSETGLVYYNYRYYSPELGRWLNRDPIGESGGVNLYGMVGNDVINNWDFLGQDWLDCVAKCIEENDPMALIMDAVLGKLAALIIGGGVPKSMLAWIAEHLMKDKKLADLIRISLKKGSDLGYKPLKMIATALSKNGKVRAAAAKSGRLGTIVLAIYGPVLAVIEIDCASYCCGKDSYDGGNTFNTKRAIKFYLDKIKFW